jgi:hypothetical protein
MANKTFTTADQIVAVTDGMYFGVDNVAAISKGVESSILKDYILAEQSYQGVVNVAKTGGDFSTIKAALASITDNDAAHRYLILIAPGNYIEDNPVTLKPFVNVAGMGGGITVSVTAQNADQHLFIGSAFMLLENLTLTGVSGAGFYAYYYTAAGPTIFRNGAITNVENGIYVNHASAELTLQNILLNQTSGTMTCGFRNNAGTVHWIQGRIGEGASITTVVECDGANAVTSLISFLVLDGTNITTFYSGKNDARTVVNVASLVFCYDVFVLESGTDLRAISTVAFLTQNDTVRINDVGADTNFAGYGFVTENTTQYDVNILSATGVVSGYGVGTNNKFNAVSGADIYTLLVDLTEGDEGVNVLGQMAIGSPERPAELVAGGGDSYTRQMIVYTYNPSGAVWTDVSTEARSVSGSTFTFPAIAQDNAIYAGSALATTDVLQHWGIKALVTVAAVLGGGEIVAEYYNGAWTEFAHMSTKSDAPYTQYATAIFERVQSDQVRYNQAIEDDWAKTDPMTYGTDLYWVRFRIKTAVTTVPVFQQFKLHTSRFEANADGVTEYFGAARPQRELIVHRLLSEVISGATPGSQSIDYSTNISIAHTANSLTNNQTKAIGLITRVPEGIDTSQPVVLEVIWIPTVDTAGDVEFEFTATVIEVGDVLDGTNTDTSSNTIVSIGAGSLDTVQSTQFEIDISELVPGELVVIKLLRDATGPNLDDTLAGAVALSSLAAKGNFWR